MANNICITVTPVTSMDPNGPLISWDLVLDDGRTHSGGGLLDSWSNNSITQSNNDIIAAAKADAEQFLGATFDSQSKVKLFCGRAS